MKIQDRKYQDEHIESIIRLLGKHRKVVAQLPTGGGKTVEFSKICKRFYDNTGKATMILVHRKELLYQTKKTIELMFGIPVSIIVAGTRWVNFSPVYIGMVESVFNRAEVLPEVGLVIIDECHNASFNKLHSVFQDQFIIGFTATPVSSSKKSPINKFYYGIATGPQISKLIAEKHLCQNITRSPKDIVERAKLEMAYNGEYDIAKMGFEFSKPKYVINTVISHRKFAKGTKTIVFNVNVQHSKDVEQCFTDCGVPCKHLDATTPDSQREEIFKWFKETRDAVLCNVGITTMGFDEPTVETIIVNRATTSMPLWLQMCGRGSRPIDQNWITEHEFEYPYILHPKSIFTIIDLGANCIVHGDWCNDRDWNWIFNNPDVPTEGGIAPMKTCPNCEGLVHAATVACPLNMANGDPCGYIFDRKKFEEDKALGEMLVITKDIDIERLMKENNDRRTYFVMFEMGRKIIDRMHSLGEEVNPQKLELVFDRYMILVHEWFKITFPNKWYDEHWHRDLARRNFNIYFKTKFTKQIEKQGQY